MQYIDAQKAASMLCETGSRLPQVKRKAESEAPLAISGPKPAPNNLSALHLFRRGMIASSKLLGRDNTDWVSSKSWADVKNAFNKLSAEEQRTWQQAAASSNAAAKAKMAKSKRHWTLVKPGDVADAADAADTVAADTVSNHDLQLRLGRAGGVTFNCWLSSPDVSILKDSMTSLSSFKVHLLNKVYYHASKKKEVDPWPVSPKNVLGSLLSLRLRGVRLRDCVRKLADICEQTSGPKDENDTFPSKVEYHQHCRGVCRSSAPLGHLDMQASIVTALNKMASRYKTPADFVRADVLLAFEISCSAGTHVEYYYATSCAFRGGVQKPVQSYFRLCKGENFETDRLLSLCPDAHVSSLRKWPHPIDRAFEINYGALKSFSTVQLAANIVNEDLPLAITVSKYNFVDICRTALKLTSIDSGFQPVKIPADTSAEVAAGSAKHQSESTSSSSAAAGRKTESSGVVDMLDFFDEEYLQASALPKPKPEAHDDTREQWMLLAYHRRLGLGRSKQRAQQALGKQILRVSSVLMS